jgi:spore germination protein GerM
MKMGELYLDNIDRYLAMEAQNGDHRKNTQNQNTEAGKDLQRRQAIPLYYVRATNTQDIDARQEALL